MKKKKKENPREFPRRKVSIAIVVFEAIDMMLSQVKCKNAILLFAHFVKEKLMDHPFHHVGV